MTLYKSTYTVDNYFDYNADNDDTQVEGPHSTSTVYVHGFGTDDSYDEEKDKHAYGYGHIDPYLNAKHGYGYSKGYGYEKTYGYGHGGYGSGHGKVNQNIKERKKYLIKKKYFRDMDTPPHTLPPHPTTPLFTGTIATTTDTPLLDMGQDTVLPHRLSATGSGMDMDTPTATVDIKIF